MKKKRILNSLIIFCLLLCSIFLCCKNKTEILSTEEKQWLKKHDGKIILAPEPDYPPINYFNDEGEFTGVASDYVSLIEKRLNFKFKVVKFKSFKMMLDQLKKKNADVGSVVVKTPDRSHFLLFTKHFITSPNVIITQKNLRDNLTLKNMAGMKIAITEGYAVNEYIRKNFSNLTIINVKNDLAGLLLVSEGKADAVISELPSASYYMAKYNLTNLRIAGQTGSEYKLGLATRKDWPIMHSILEKGLATITDDERQEIYRKWISLAPEKEKSMISNTVIFIILSVLFISIFYFSYRLYKGTRSKIKKEPKSEGTKYFRKSNTPFIITGILLITTAMSLALVYYFSIYNEEQLLLTREEQQWLDKNSDKITFAQAPKYPPIAFVNEDNKNAGITEDLLQLIEIKCKTKFKRVNYNSWYELIKDAKKGKVDIVGSIQNLNDRQSYLNFTEPYITTPNKIVVRKDIKGSLTLKDMGGKLIIIVKGYTSYDHIKRKFPYLNLRHVEDTLTGLQMVSFGRADAIITDTSVASYYIEKVGISNLRIAGDAEYTWRLCFATMKNKPILHSIMQKGLQQITKKEKNQIFERWIGIDRSFQFTNTYWYITITILLILIISYIVITIWNITLKREVKEKTTELQSAYNELADTKSLLESVIEQSPIPMVLVSIPDMIMRMINPACEKILGIEDEESKIGMSLLGMKQSWQDFHIDGTPLTVHEMPLAKAASGIRTHKDEYMIKRKDGTIRYEIVDGVPIYNKEGDLIAGYIIFPDITDQKIAEENIKKSLHEKEILLKEIHHRVKNNMQIISSLLNLQAFSVSDEKDKQLFMDSRRRVHSMAMIHEKLYQSETFSEINFHDFIKDLVKDIFTSYNVLETNISVTIDAKDINLTMDTAIPCALIINELVSNSIKYAFTDITKGEIYLSLRKSDEDNYTITVKDNGKGLPENFRFESAETLGLQLVQALVSQLNGSLTIDRKNGSAFIISFKYPD